TFIGAAGCYRAGSHMSVSVLLNALPPPGRRAPELLGDAVMALISIFMVIWGGSLVETTWPQSIAEFPSLSVGVTYLPIPIGGAITFLFVLERVLIGAPPPRGAH